MLNSLNKIQFQQYLEIKKEFEKEKVICLSDADYVRTKEVLLLLTELEYIHPLKLNDRNAFLRIGNFDDFEKWNKNKAKEETKLSRRDWWLMIVGALIGQIPAILSWIINLLNK